MDWTRRALSGATLAACLSSAARAQVPDLSSAAVSRGRVVVPLQIDGHGPFWFGVDTAANASVIADDLARSLNLAPAGEVGMHTLIARETAATVRAARLDTGALKVRDVRLALASRAGLDGSDGLIGTDLLANLRLDMRFRTGARARIARSRHDNDRFWDGRRPSARLVRAVEQRFGQLLLIDAQVGGVEALAIIDTGAQATIINTALARESHATPIVLRDGTRRAVVQSPTGLTAVAEPMMVRSLRFGGVTLGRLPVLAGDFHTFDLWGLQSRPALLLGVDVLGLFDSVDIDLRRGEMIFDTV